MAGRWQVGKSPDSDSSVLNKSYVDNNLASLLVTTDFVNAQLATTGATLVTPTYVDNADGALAHQTDVTAADQLYVPTSSLNVANGVAGIDNTGMAQSAQIPSGVPNSYPVLSYNAATDGQIFLGGSATQAVSTSTLREYQLATISIADPGYPYIVLPFGFVQGADPTSGGGDPGRTKGTGNFGLLSVLPPAGVSDQIYGVGLCTATYRFDYYKVSPYATNAQTPTTVPPIHGALQLGLYGCCWTGAEYTYSGSGLIYWVLVLPAMGA